MAKKETMGQQLRRWRRAADITQEEFAARVGVNSAPIISTWERDHAVPSFASALAIERVTKGGVKVEAWGFDRKTATRVQR